VKVVYKRPPDLALLRDVPVYCNLCIADGLLDDGLLAAGLIPAFKHALDHLLLPDVTLMPSSAIVYMQVTTANTHTYYYYYCYILLLYYYQVLSLLRCSLQGCPSSAQGSSDKCKHHGGGEGCKILNALPPPSMMFSLAIAAMGTARAALRTAPE
jgi:hypothetical protein